MGQVKPFTVIEDPSAWKAADLRLRPQEWTYHVTPQDVADLDAALAGVYAKGIQDADQVHVCLQKKTLATINHRQVSTIGLTSRGQLQVQRITVADFPLPTFGPKLRQLAKEAHSGRGFQLIR